MPEERTVDEGRRMFLKTSALAAAAALPLAKALAQDASSSAESARPFARLRDYRLIGEKPLKEVMEKFIADYMNPNGSPRDQRHLGNDAYTFNEVLLRISQDVQEREGNIRTAADREQFYQRAQKVSEEVYAIADDIDSELRKRKSAAGGLSDMDMLDAVRHVFFEKHRFGGFGRDFSESRERKHPMHIAYDPCYLEVCESRQGICEDLSGVLSSALNILRFRGHNPPISHVLLPVLGKQTHTLLRMKRDEAQDPTDARKSGLYLEMTEKGGRIETYEQYVKDIKLRKAHGDESCNLDEIETGLSPCHWLSHPLAAVSLELNNQSISMGTRKDATDAQLDCAICYLDWAIKLSPQYPTLHSGLGTNHQRKAMGIDVFDLNHIDNEQATLGLRKTSLIGDQEKVDSIQNNLGKAGKIVFRTSLGRELEASIKDDAGVKTLRVRDTGDILREIVLVIETDEERRESFAYLMVPKESKVHHIRLAADSFGRAIDLSHEVSDHSQRACMNSMLAKLTTGPQRVKCLTLAASDLTACLGVLHHGYDIDNTLWGDRHTAETIGSYYEQAYRQSNDVDHLKKIPGVWDKLLATYDKQDWLRMSGAFTQAEKGDHFLRIAQASDASHRREWFSKAYQEYAKALARMKADHERSRREFTEGKVESQGSYFERAKKEGGVISKSHLLAFEGLYNMKMGRLFSVAGMQEQARSHFTDAVGILGYKRCSVSDILHEYTELGKPAEKPRSGEGVAVRDSAFHARWASTLSAELSKIKSEPTASELLEASLALAP